MQCKPSKPWSVAQFEQERPALVRFLQQKIVPLVDAVECRRILIRAPVKSGKREMVEYLSVRDQSFLNPDRVHTFVTAFHRVADKEQRKELKHHNVDVFSLTGTKPVEECLEWMQQQLAQRRRIVVHVDECDFGTGDLQNLAKVYLNIRDHPSITVILYSATPQEALFSEDIESQDLFHDMCQGTCVTYTPPPQFCGPETFLAERLVHEARPFFRKRNDTLELTDQGREIMVGLRESTRLNGGRNILVLRLSYSDLGGDKNQRRENKAIYQFVYGWQSIPELNDCLIIVDKSEKDLPGLNGITRQKIEWSQPNWWRHIAKDELIVLVIDQTSARSTEWVCHDRVFAYHDFRNTITFNTISQAQERVNHYSTKYRHGFQRIQVYGHVKTFKLSAGQITYKEYLSNDWEVRKVSRRTVQDADVYRVQHTLTHAVHPRYNQLYPKSEADEILQNLGCHADVKLSSRVRGGIHEKPVYAVEFVPCAPQTFFSVFAALNIETYQNPFVRAEREGLVDGKYQGYLRGWKVLDFERDIKEDVGAGVKDGDRFTICYNGDVLGVAYRYNTGQIEEVDTRQSYKSMYNA